MGDRKTSSDDDYDPYKERNSPHPTNYIESLGHIVKSILGTGILALPEVFKNAGMACGFFWCILNGSLCTYGVHIIVKSMYMLCKRNKIPVLTYTEAMRLAFEQGSPLAQKMSRTAGTITDVFIIIYQVGVLSVYDLFIVSNLKLVCDFYFKYSLSIQTYLMWIIVPLLLIASMRNLKILAPFSIGANVVTIATILMVYYFIFRTPLPAISKRPLVGSFKKLPLVFGTTCFAFQSIALAITIENNMKNAKHFAGMFGAYNLSFYFLMVLYLSLGFLGYWKFGDDTKSSITLNFPEHCPIGQTVSLLFALAILISCGINGHCVMQLLWDQYVYKRVSDSTWPLGWDYLLRWGTMILGILMAATIPLLGIFMSLFGAISLSHLIFIFPGSLDLCARYPSNYGPCQFYKWRDIIFMGYGIIGLFTGTYTGILEIVDEFKKK